MQKPKTCPICGGECEEKESGGYRFHKGLCNYIGGNYAIFEDGELKVAKLVLERVRLINKFNEGKNV